MRTKFLITSAVNSRFGIVPKEERFNQTLNTISTIKHHALASDNDLVLIDMCGDPLTSEQIKIFENTGTEVITYNDENVQKIYKIESQDIVKNLTEMICFSDYLNKNQFFDTDRVFKISGRYQLTEKFNPNEYTTVLSDCIVFSGQYASQFQPEITGNPPNDNSQYMSRIWSFNPKFHLNIVRAAYFDMIKGMVDRLNAGGYIDIEHLLYRCMPKDEIKFKTPSGLTGGIAPNGYVIND